MGTNKDAGAAAGDDWLRAIEAVAVLKAGFGEHSARMRICQRAHAGLIRSRAEHYQVDQKGRRDVDLPREFWWAEGHEALEQDWIAGDFSTWIDHRYHLKAFGVSFARADILRLVQSSAHSGDQSQSGLTGDDVQIVEKLVTLLPSAGLSYQQAILDLRDDHRVSFRGPALELREALREVLDHLAPDAEVTAQPGYVQGPARNGPTMKQKVRFILRKRGTRSSGDAPELAAEAFEEAVGGLTRAVYELSSKATHVASERRTVEQLRRYVLAILHDILV